MNRSRFSDPQILAILLEAAAGACAAALCRKYHISDTTFYNWRRKFGSALPPPTPEQLSHENRLLRRRLQASEKKIALLQRTAGR